MAKKNDNMPHKLNLNKYTCDTIQLFHVLFRPKEWMSTEDLNSSMEVLIISHVPPSLFYMNLLNFAIGEF